MTGSVFRYYDAADELILQIASTLQRGTQKHPAVVDNNVLTTI